MLKNERSKSFLALQTHDNPEISRKMSEIIENATLSQLVRLRELSETSGYSLEYLVKNSSPPSHIFPEIGISNFHGMYIAIMPDGTTHS